MNSDRSAKKILTVVALVNLAMGPRPAVSAADLPNSHEAHPPGPITNLASITGTLTDKGRDWIKVKPEHGGTATRLYLPSPKDARTVQETNLLESVSAIPLWSLVRAEFSTNGQPHLVNLQMIVAIRDGKRLSADDRKAAVARMLEEQRKAFLRANGIDGVTTEDRNSRKRDENADRKDKPRDLRDKAEQIKPGVDGKPDGAGKPR